MTRSLRTVLVFSLLLFVSHPALAQLSRPVPYPVFPIPGYTKAVEKGTRTLDGNPGPNYWMNTAEYDIDVVLSPETAILQGQETIRYTNNSPDTLDVLYLHLRQNLHAEGAPRNFPAEVTGGMTVSRITVNGKSLVSQLSQEVPGYTISGTILRIRLAQPLFPGNWVELGLTWSFRVPERAPRMGQDGELFYLGYWYPQMAVYDDVRGWKADPYLGAGEFYMGYGNYDVSITLPEGWLVAATGELQNPEEVYPGQIRARLQQASYANETVPIVTQRDLNAGLVTVDSPDDLLTWRFRAENVRDFAFSASINHVWDATTAALGDRENDGQPDRAMIHAYYRSDKDGWARAAEYAQFSIEHLSETFFPYPYPHMTVVEGIIGGGMEYPMMTLIGTTGDRGVFATTFHEISHMWFPMVVGSDEKEYAWMDEGLTTFNTNEAWSAYFDTDGWTSGSHMAYFVLAESGEEVEPMRHTDLFPSTNRSTWRVGAYGKPALALRALQGLYGDKLMEAYRTYAERWAFKHPYPYDLFNTFEDVIGEDLDWFWTSMFYETWTLDHAVTRVNTDSDGVVVEIADRGLTPMPAPVRVVYSNGNVEEQIVPVDTWLSGKRTATLRFTPGRVDRVQIDPDWYLPDVDRTNNTWVR